jgi:PAS domain S-box-containing protein
MNEEILRRRLQRLQERVDALEQMIEDRSREVFVANEKLRATAEFHDQVYKTMPSALVVFDQDGVIEAANDGTAKLLGYSKEELLGMPASRILASEDPRHFEHIRALARHGADVRTEETYRSRSGSPIPVLLSASVFGGAPSAPDEERKVVCVALDIRDRKRLEQELRHAQKLESVGHLAAGIAHEINTPIQFVGDNIRFLQDAFDDLTRVVAAYRDLDGPARAADVLLQARKVEAEVDVEYLVGEVPQALDQTLEGVERVATIVRAMKTFAHPSTEDKAPADLNEAVCNTLVVANNEVKYAADVVTDLGDLPLVPCHLGDINAVLLNLVVNAAHAVTARVRDTGERGTITVRTRRDGDEVVIEVADTGVGIPPEIADRVFEPFFTTKEVGKGTGQGLALAYSIVYERHGGSIRFDSRPGTGTTFTVRLPVRGAVRASASTSGVAA